MDPLVIDKLLDLKKKLVSILDISLLLAWSVQSSLMDRLSRKSIRLHELERGKLYALNVALYTNGFDPKLIVDADESFLLLDWTQPTGNDQYMELKLLTGEGLQHTARLKRYTVERRLRKL